MTSNDFLKAFFEHLNELRSRFIRSVSVFLLAAFVCFNYADQALHWIIKPAGQLVFTSPGGAFSAVMITTVVMAAVVASPYLLYHLWSFVGKALRPHERKFILVVGPLSLLLFLAGVAFAFFVAVPMAYRFLMSFSSPDLRPMISVDSYLGFLGNMVLSFGVTFELPLVLGFLAKIGIATPEFLRQKRRHAIVIILIVAAVLTPPDVASQCLLAVPLIVLYELGILVVRLVYKHKTL